MSDPAKLLVAERDDELREHLIDQLAADGFRTRSAPTAAEARCRADHGPDLLLLGELEAPTSALQLLRELRAGEALNLGADAALPVIVLSSAVGEWVPLRAFEAGCDDFMRKPVHYLELRGRIRALLRRCSPGYGRRLIRVGALAMELAGREAHYDGRHLALSRMEFALLAKLALEPTRVCTKEELLREVWGFKALGKTRTVDAHASRLRRKLALAGAPSLIVNVRGVGYRLVERRPLDVDHGEPEAIAPTASAPLIELRSQARAA